MTARTVGLVAGEPLDGCGRPIPAPHDQTIVRLETALQRVLTPVAYVHTADTEDADARAAAAEDARAQVGLMLFMIEGLVRASVRQREKGISDVVSGVHEAWLRWLQLGDRHARVEVPMDGWLIEAFPRDWLQSASGFADALAMTCSIGRPSPLLSDAELPLPFFEPLSHCHLGWAESGVRRDIAALLGVGAFFEGWGDSAQIPPVLRQVADTLFRDLCLTMQGLPVGGWARYPGY